MSKQRYLLIILLLIGASLLCANSLKTEFIAVTGDFEPIWQNRTTLDAEFGISRNLQFGINSKLDAADALLRDFPQHKWMNTLLALDYQIPHLKLNAGYRNTLWGSSQRLGLFPTNSPSFEYRRTLEHQSQIAAEGSFSNLSLNAHGIHRNLVVKPTEYVMDMGTFELIPVERETRGLDNLYYGVSSAYEPFKNLKLTAFTDMKQANFDADDTYSLNSVGAQASYEYNLAHIASVSGNFTWTNRYNETLPREAANLMQSSIRIQHGFLPNLNGYLSYSNNSCSDASLNDFYLISNLVRCQLQYHFSYDPSLDSYILAGFKYSPDNEADAYFAEARSMILPRLYTQIGFKSHPDLYNQYQSKVSYYFTPFSELFIQYRLFDPENQNKSLNYLGLGSSIYF